MAHASRNRDFAAVTKSTPSPEAPAGASDPSPREGIVTSSK